jgi:hypothetical protein
MIQFDKIRIPYFNKRQSKTDVTPVKPGNNFIRKIEVVYNQNDDTFRTKIDMVLSGNQVYCQGVIIQEKSYDKCIYIDVPKDALQLHLSSVKMLSIGARDFPNTFALIKTYVHTIGDMLDYGVDYAELPHFIISAPNDHTIFTDGKAMAYQELLTQEGAKFGGRGRLPQWALWIY